MVVLVAEAGGSKWGSSSPSEDPCPTATGSKALSSLKKNYSVSKFSENMISVIPTWFQVTSAVTIIFWFSDTNFNITYSLITKIQFHLISDCTWLSASHNAFNSFNFVSVKGRFRILLSLRFRTRRWGMRPISSGIDIRLLARMENSVRPVQLPSWNEGRRVVKRRTN